MQRDLNCKQNLFGFVRKYEITTTFSFSIIIISASFIVFLALALLLVRSKNIVFNCLQMLDGRREIQHNHADSRLCDGIFKLNIPLQHRARLTGEIAKRSSRSRNRGF